MYKFVAGFALIVITFWGCKDEMNKTGFDLLLPGDLVSARKVTVDKTTIKSYTVTDEKLRTNKPEFNLLGTFNDPVFGKTTTDFACQFRVGVYHDFTGAIFDTLKLTLLYRESYGDMITPQSLKVYELNSDLNGLDNFLYYQDIDLKSMAKSEVLAENMYVPKFKLDSLTNKYGSTKKIPKDTVQQEINFYLDLSLAEKLMAADSLQRSDNDAFLKYFKGLYIEAGDLNEGGSIIRTRPMAAASEMNLYYHKPNDTTKYVISYRMNSSSARTSRFDHYKYLTARFANTLDKPDQQDSLIYLQTTGGLSSKIEIPSLSNWKDSVNCAINKAELILQVDNKSLFEIISPNDTIKFTVPEKVILSLIDKEGKIFDSKGSLISPSDLALGEAYYGGTYDPKLGTYRFNLANHLQDIIKGKGNYGFYLTTDNKNAIFRRVVLKGANSKVGIRFDITYTKIK